MNKEIINLKNKEDIKIIKKYLDKKQNFIVNIDSVPLKEKKETIQILFKQMEDAKAYSTKIASGTYQFLFK